MMQESNRPIYCSVPGCEHPAFEPTHFETMDGPACAEHLVDFWKTCSALAIQHVRYVEQKSGIATVEYIKGQPVPIQGLKRPH
jgi:hypothetical protein